MFLDTDMYFCCGKPKAMIPSIHWWYQFIYLPFITSASRAQLLHWEFWASKKQDNAPYPSYIIHNMSKMILQLSSSCNVITLHTLLLITLLQITLVCLDISAAAVNTAALCPQRTECVTQLWQLHTSGGEIEYPLKWVQCDSDKKKTNFILVKQTAQMFIRQLNTEDRNQMSSHVKNVPFSSVQFHVVVKYQNQRNAAKVVDFCSWHTCCCRSSRCVFEVKWKNTGGTMSAAAVIWSKTK